MIVVVDDKGVTLQVNVIEIDIFNNIGYELSVLLILSIFALKLLAENIIVKSGLLYL